MSRFVPYKRETIECLKQIGVSLKARTIVRISLSITEIVFSSRASRKLGRRRCRPKGRSHRPQSKARNLCGSLCESRSSFCGTWTTADWSLREHFARGHSDGECLPSVEEWMDDLRRCAGDCIAGGALEDGPHNDDDWARAYRVWPCDQRANRTPHSA